MHPARPDEPPLGADGPPVDGLDAAEVGAFPQGTPLSRWALARYLVGRSVAESVGWSLLTAGIVPIAFASGVQPLFGATAVSVVLLVIGLVILVFRWVLLAVLSSLTSARALRPVDEQLRALVADTRTDTMHELRRIGLPSHTMTIGWIAVRLVGKRRAETMTRLREFDVSRAVPQARIDELHMLMRGALDRPAP